jgi:hypothetical protein
MGRPLLEGWAIGEDGAPASVPTEVRSTLLNAPHSTPY